MRIILASFLLASLVIAHNLQAQDVYVSGATGSATYYAITTQAPVETGTPLACAPPAPCRTPACIPPTTCSVPVAVCYPAAPNVIFFGGANNHRNFYSPALYGYGRPGAQVIFFGRGQAYRQGYVFTRCR